MKTRFSNTYYTYLMGIYFACYEIHKWKRSIIWNKVFVVVLLARFNVISGLLRYYYEYVRCEWNMVSLSGCTGSEMSCLILDRRGLLCALQTLNHPSRRLILIYFEPIYESQLMPFFSTIRPGLLAASHHHPLCQLPTNSPKTSSLNIIWWLTALFVLINFTLISSIFRFRPGLIFWSVVTLACFCRSSFRTNFYFMIQQWC